MDNVPAGVTVKNNDGIIYDMGDDGVSASGFGHPRCGGQEPQIAEQIGASAKGAAPFTNAKNAAVTNRSRAKFTSNQPVPEPGLSINTRK